MDENVISLHTHRGPRPGEIAASMKIALDRAVQRCFPRWQPLPDDHVQLRHPSDSTGVQLSVTRADESDRAEVTWDIGDTPMWFQLMLDELEADAD